MLPQIGGLGDKYNDWVNLPVDRDLRLFGPWYLECLTKTPWWMVPLFWVPNISYLVVNEWKTNNQVRDISFLFMSFIIVINKFNSISVAIWNTSCPLL